MFKFNKSMVAVFGVALALTAALPLLADRGDRENNRRGDNRVGRGDNRGGNDDRRGGHNPPGPGHYAGPVREHRDPRGPRNGRFEINRGRNMYRPNARIVIRDTHRRNRRPMTTLEVLYRFELLRGDITMLGSTRLEQITDFDVIPVHQCGIRQLQVRVRDNDARIDHIIAYFENGDSDEIDVREHFEEGSNSAWRDLPGYRRCVRQIVVIGDTQKDYRYDNRQALVEIFGRR